MNAAHPGSARVPRAGFGVSPKRTFLAARPAHGWLVAAMALIPAARLTGASPLPATMKAVVAHEYGAPSVLKLEEIPVPLPKENEVLVRVIASGVNPADPLIIGGKYAKEFGTHLPLIPGYDMAGIVEKIGTAIDYTKTKFEDAAKDVDVVIDPVGGDTLARSYALVKKGGIIVTLVSRCDPVQLEKYGIRGDSLASHPNAIELNEITKLIEAKKIKPMVSQGLPLAEATRAAEQAETHHTRGKVVLKVRDEPGG